MNLSSNFNRLSLNKMPVLKQTTKTETQTKNEPVVVQKQPTKMPTAATVTASALEAQGLENMTFISTAKTVQSKAAAKTQHLTEAEAKEQGYTIIKTAEDLANMEGSVRGSKFILMGDIDMSTIKDWKGLNLCRSEFNGNGYTIKNLTGNHGLFKYVGDGSTIKNVNIDGANIKASGNGVIGVLADKMVGEGSIEGCNITNSTLDVGTNSVCAGFLIGCKQDKTDKEKSEGTISDCHVSSSSIVGKGRCTPEIGGLIGESQISQLTLSNCSFEGNIEAEGEFVGGLIGRTSNSLVTEIGCSSNITKQDEIQYKFPDLIDMEQDKKDMEAAAKKQGLTASNCDGVYYKTIKTSKGEQKVYYSWNSNDKQFERLNDVKSINKDGSYVNSKGQSIKKPANEQIAARVGGYTPTVEEGTYFKDGKYYNFDEYANEFIEVDKSLYEVQKEDKANDTITINLKPGAGTFTFKPIGTFNGAFKPIGNLSGIAARGLYKIK